MHPQSKQDRRLVRTRQRQPDPYTGRISYESVDRQPAPRGWDVPRRSRRAELVSAIQEWADDLEGTHSIFED